MSVQKKHTFVKLIEIASKIGWIANNNSPFLKT